MRISKEEIIRVGLIKYVKQNYDKLTKRQIFMLFTKYMWAVYLRNGQTHVEGTLDMLDKLDKEEVK